MTFELGPQNPGPLVSPGGIGDPLGQVGGHWWCRSCGDFMEPRWVSTSGLGGTLRVHPSGGLFTGRHWT